MKFEGLFSCKRKKMSKEDSIESTQKGLRAIQELDYCLVYNENLPKTERWSWSTSTANDGVKRVRCAGWKVGIRSLIPPKAKVDWPHPPWNRKCYSSLETRLTSAVWASDVSNISFLLNVNFKICQDMKVDKFFLNTN